MEVRQEPKEVLGFELVEQESEADLTHLFVHPLNLDHLVMKKREDFISRSLLPISTRNTLSLPLSPM